MRGLLFLFSALFLLEPTKGGEYEKLNDHDRKIVDQAIEQGNKLQTIDKHLDFYKMRKIHNQMVNVILRPTSCDKTTPSGHQEQCETDDKKPPVFCFFCKGTIMETCLFVNRAEQIEKKKNECPSSVKSHKTGSGYILFHKEEEKPLTGCLGCI